MSNWQIPLRPGLEKIQPYQPGKPVEEVERELGIAHAIKLASNENPLGPSALVKTALRASLNQVAIYPDGACFYLRQALAKHLKVKPEKIILGNGSDELLVLLGRCFLRNGEEVLISQMTFVVYTLVAHMHNAHLITIPMRDYTYNLDAMLKAITPSTRIIYICNPNNPTGTAVEPERLKLFIEQVPAQCLVVLDEAYYEYMDKSMQPASLDWVRMHPNVVVLRIFSKVYALAGLRVGYGVAAPEVGQAVNLVRDPFNVNALAQVAALAALKDQAHVRKSVQLARQERKRISGELTQLGLQVIPSQANFIFVNIGNGNPAAPDNSGQALAQALILQGVIVRPFPGPYIRITLGTAAQNNRLLRALKQVLKSL